MAGIGPAGKNQVVFSTVLAAENASGSSGFGAVMGSKNLKAVVVKIAEKKWPVAADPDTLKALARQVYKLRTTNFEDYGHILPLKIRFVSCYGCISGCTRGSYEAEGGPAFCGEKLKDSLPYCVSNFHKNNFKEIFGMKAATLGVPTQPH